MNRDLILVIDMQNVYGDGGQWCCPGVPAATEKILTLLNSEKVSASDVIFTRFLAPQDPVGVWQQYNVENEEVNTDPYSNAMMESFAPYLQRYPLLTKSTYSSLEIPEVAEAAKKADRVVVTGVVAECCVLATVMALIDMGASVIYLTDGVAGINKETEQAVELVLSGLEPLHVRRMTVDQYITNRGEIS